MWLRAWEGVRGWRAPAHVRLGSWLSTSSVPTTHELFSGPQPLQNIFIVPTDPARREATRESGGAGLSVARARSAPSGRRAGREERFPEAPATRSRRSSRSPARRRAPPTTSVRPSQLAGAPWRPGGALRRPRAGSVRRVQPPARPRRHHSAPTCGGAAEPGGGREKGREPPDTAGEGSGGGASRAEQRCPGLLLRGCVLPTRPSEPAGRARASERPEESMVPNLAAD